MGTEPRLTGTVRWWKPKKGYGRITGDDGEIYFVHFSDVVADTPGYRALQEGQRVEFEWLGGRVDHERKHANNVTVV
jgi:CspA family cold shock protein